MKITKHFDGYNLIPEYSVDLMLCKQILEKNTEISFYDYRRNKSSLQSAKETRGDLQLVKVDMCILKSNIEENKIIIDGAIAGSSFHKYIWDLGTSIRVHKKIGHLEKSLIQYSKNLKPLILIFVDTNEYTIVELKDYTYTIYIHDEFKDDAISENVVELAKLIKKNKIEQFILVSNFIIRDVLNTQNLNFVFYPTNIPCFRVLDKKNFYTSNEFKKLKNFTNMHIDAEIYQKIDRKKIIDLSEFEEYDLDNIANNIYIPINELGLYYNKFNYKLICIVSQQFSEVYNLPKIFAELKYVPRRE